MLDLNVYLMQYNLPMIDSLMLVLELSILQLEALEDLQMAQMRRWLGQKKAMEIKVSERKINFNSVMLIILCLMNSL